MDRLYWLRAPIAAPRPPDHWSFSSLGVWRGCPKQWWLERAAYPNVSGIGYPPKIHHTALRGRLIHRTLEELAKATMSERVDGVVQPTPAAAVGTFPVRKVMRNALESLLSDISKTNPRSDVEELRSRVSFDDCVNLLKAILTSTPPNASRATPQKSTDASPSHGDRPQSRLNGAEVSIEVRSPPIAGRLDFVESGAIVEFKTGAPADAHLDQLRFYAMLWWLRTGRPPTSLSLLYAGEHALRRVEVPGEGDLRDSAERVSVEISAIEGALADSAVSARPDIETCKRCSVRQLCDEYWSAPATEQLRGVRGGGAGLVADAGSSRADLELVSLPESWRVGEACIGQVTSISVGSLRASIPAEKCPPAGSHRPSRARLLGAILRAGPRGPEAFATQETEVFWMEEGSVL
jgi:CRISPR/Cas system-associated exonuclease Cas4 (RecB family)